MLSDALDHMRRSVVKACKSFACTRVKTNAHLVPRLAPQVSATIARGRLKRCFSEWKRLAQERWWKNQFAMRDETIHALEVGGLMLRCLVCT